MRVGGHRFRRRRQQPRTPGGANGQRVRAADAAAPAEMVGAFDNNGVGGRNIDAGFNDGGAHQHVETLMMEIVHHPLQIALAHLPVSDSDARLRHQFRQPLRRLFDILHVVIEIVDRRRAKFHAGSPRAPPDDRIRAQRFSPPDVGRAG